MSKARQNLTRRIARLDRDISVVAYAQQNRLLAERDRLQERRMSEIRARLERVIACEGKEKAA